MSMLEGLEEKVGHRDRVGRSGVRPGGQKPFNHGGLGRDLPQHPGRDDGVHRASRL